MNDEINNLDRFLLLRIAQIVYKVKLLVFTLTLKGAVEIVSVKIK